MRRTLDVYAPRPLKIILPGEYGYTDGGPIGTFAVGSGCRGYLVTDNTTREAGLAHVDFDDLDIPIIEEMIQHFGNSVRLGYTRNARTAVRRHFSAIECFELPNHCVTYDPTTCEIGNHIDQEAKSIAFGQRIGILARRLHVANSALIQV